MTITFALWRQPRNLAFSHEGKVKKRSPMEWGFSGSYAVEAVFRYGLRSALAREASRPMAGGFNGSFHDQGLTVHFLRRGKAHHIQNLRYRAVRKFQFEIKLVVSKTYDHTNDHSI